MFTLSAAFWFATDEIGVKLPSPLIGVKLSSPLTGVKLSIPLIGVKLLSPDTGVSLFFSGVTGVSPPKIPFDGTGGIWLCEDFLQLVCLRSLAWSSFLPSVASGS